MISPIAIGILVLPDDMEFQKLAMFGKRNPDPTPAAMATNIQRVKYRSRKDNFLVKLPILFLWFILVNSCL